MSNQYELDAFVDDSRDNLLFKVRRWIEQDRKEGVLYSVPLERVESDLGLVPAGMEYPIQAFQEERQDSILEAVEILVRLARKTIEGRSKFVDRVYTRCAYIKEFRTIRVGGARQTGHTTAALALAAKYNGLIIVPNCSMAADVKRAGAAKVFSSEQVRSGHARGYTYDAVVVDVATHTQDLEGVLTEASIAIERSRDPWVFILE